MGANVRFPPIADIREAKTASPASMSAFCGKPKSALAGLLRAVQILVVPLHGQVCVKLPGRELAIPSSWCIIQVIRFWELVMIVALVVLSLFQAPVADTRAVSHRLYPPQPLIENSRLGQAINFDVELTNNGSSELDLIAVRAAVRDAGGKIVQRLEVNDNGGAPSIATLPATKWKPGEAHTIYNPFHTLAADIPIGRIDLEFVFRTRTSGRSPTP